MAHTIVMATELVDNTTMEYKVKTSSIDSEENNKDFKLDLFVSYQIVNTLLQTKKPIPTCFLSASDDYLKSLFKPPRA